MKQKGVYWFARDRLWVAEIGIGGAQIYLGRFRKYEDAAAAYEAAAQARAGQIRYRPPSAGKRLGRPPDIARNRAFLAEWDAAPRGARTVLAEKWGFASRASAAVIAHRLRTYGATSAYPPTSGPGSWPTLDTAP